MGIVSEKLVGLVYRDPTTMDYNILYPKTVGAQVELNDGSENTAHDHVLSNTHITRFDRQRLNNVNIPLGLVTLDEKGFIDQKYLDPSLIVAKVEHANIAAMLQDNKSLPHALVFVFDATDDPNTTSDWAMYRRTDDPDYSSLEKGWTKVAEHESLDIDQTWVALASILPNATPEEIDDMVGKIHYHENLDALEAFARSNDGTHLTFHGEEIANRDDVAHWLFGDYFPDEEIRGGDVWIKSVPGQFWWYSDSIESAGNSCYEKYAGNTLMISAPKWRTENVTTFCRMFYNNTALEEIPQYNFQNAIDVSGFVQECKELKSVPYMNTYKCKNFNKMFYGCTKLIYAPEMYMSRATSMDSMYAGCVNLIRVLPFGNTGSVTNMKNAFSGCSALTRIDSPIDFSSITSAANVVDMFYDCIELEYVRVVPNSLSVSISFENTNILKDSILSIFEGLKAYTGAEDYAPVLNLTGVEAVGLLSEDELAIPTTKGWQLVK